MCLLWLVFVVPVAALFLSPFIALIFGVTAVATSVQKKKQGADVVADSEELNQRVSKQVGLFFFLLLCLFLGFLVVRYLMT